MGRGVTSARFNEEFAKRLAAARVSAGYKTQEEFVEVLGCSIAAYRKYEQGRTVLPHRLIQRACAILHKDANYFFDVEPVEVARKRAAG